MPSDDIDPADVLTPQEYRRHKRAKHPEPSCPDGTCGGCPRCGYQDDDAEDEG
jgi:hypothetical protein